MPLSEKQDHHFAEKYFFILLGITIIFWAMAFPFIKIGLRELSPVNLTVMRLLVVCIVFILLLLLFPRSFTKLQKKDVPKIFLLGFLGVIVYHLGLNYGEQYVSASAASLIIATIPIFVVILAVFFLKEKITIQMVFGIILSLSGVSIIALLGAPDTSLEIPYISGALMVLVAAIVGSGYVIGGKKLLQRYSALSLTVYAFLLGSLGLLPFIRVSLFEEMTMLSVTGWSAVIFLGLCPTVVAYILWYVILQIRTASELSVYLYFIPVLSTIMSFLLFQEEITVFFIVGGIFVIMGLYVVNKQERLKKKKT